MPLSWMIILIIIASIGGYIAYLIRQRKRAEKRAAAALQERDQAIVEQHVTQKAQSAERAYQEAYDDVLQQSENTREKGSGDDHSRILSRLNNSAPLLLCLVMAGCMVPACTTATKTIEVTPAERVVIPAADPLERYTFRFFDNEEPSNADALIEFYKQNGLFCIDPADAKALANNFDKRLARIKGLEAVLRELGVEIKAATRGKP